MRAYNEARSIPDQKSSSNWFAARRAEVNTMPFLPITHHELSEISTNPNRTSCTIRLALAIGLQNDKSWVTDNLPHQLPGQPACRNSPHRYMRP